MIEVFWYTEDGRKERLTELRRWFIAHPNAPDLDTFSGAPLIVYDPEERLLSNKEAWEVIYNKTLNGQPVSL